MTIIYAVGMILARMLSIKAANKKFLSCSLLLSYSSTFDFYDRVAVRVPLSSESTPIIVFPAPALSSRIVFPTIQ
jgi:hypothetical protein